MDFMLKNESSIPQFCEALGIVISANAVTRILSAGELRVNERDKPEWASLIPVVSEMAALDEVTGADSNRPMPKGRGKKRNVI